MLDATTWATIGPLLAETVQQVVAPYAVTAVLEHVPGVPPVVNTRRGHRGPAAVGHAAPAWSRSAPPQSLGGEDFAWYLRQVPGAMARLGTRTPGGPTFDLHQGDLVVDEAAVAWGARLLAGAVVAERSRRRLSPESRVGNGFSAVHTKGTKPSCPGAILTP